MTKYTEDEIKNKIAELGGEQPWHHNIKLPYDIWTCLGRIETPAKNIKKWSRLESIISKIDLKGSKVLDVGCSEGYYSFKVSKMGAREVIALDLNKLRLKKAEFVKEVLCIDNVIFKKMNIMDVSENTMGRFNLVLCFGFLHRFPDIFGLLKKLTDLSDIIALEWKIPRMYHNNLPIMAFATSHINGCDEYNVSYWYPTITCVMEILNRLGFSYHYPVDDGLNKRVALVSSKQPIDLGDNKYEIQTKNAFCLVVKYTKIYLKNLYRIISGKVRA